MAFVRQMVQLYNKYFDEILILHCKPCTNFRHPLECMKNVKSYAACMRITATSEVVHKKFPIMIGSNFDIAFRIKPDEFTKEDDDDVRTL